MIKLTEVATLAKQYNPEKKGMEVQYILKNLYINPEFIVSMEDNERLNQAHVRKSIFDNLSPEARFTKLALSSGRNGITYHDILGHPELIITTMTSAG